MDLYIWLTILLGINWGGFIILLVRTMRKETARVKEKKQNP